LLVFSILVWIFAYIYTINDKELLGLQPFLNVKKYAILFGFLWMVLIGCVIVLNVHQECNDADNLVRPVSPFYAIALKESIVHATLFDGLKLP